MSFGKILYVTAEESVHVVDDVINKYELLQQWILLK